jgi:hypothetical protein
MSDINHPNQDVGTDTIHKIVGILKKSNGKLNILIKDNPAFSITLGSNIELNIHDAAIFAGVGNEKSDMSLLIG